MKILQIHVRYTTTLTSGENSTTDNISGYLAEFAELETLKLSMPKNNLALLDKLRHLVTQFRAMNKLFNASKFDLIFVHNQIPFLPSFLLAFLSKRAQVVKVWHNQRPFCIKGSSFLNGEICNRCSKSKFGRLNSISNNCYRDNRLQTILAELNQFRILSFLKSDKIFHLTVSNFLKNKLILEGFDPERVFCIQNAVDKRTYAMSHGNDFVFLGRLCSEKGIDKLLEAWKFYKMNFPGSQNLHIIGDGPLFLELKNVHEDSRTIFYGHLNTQQIFPITKMAGIGIIPNQWEEPFGKVALDFLSFGLRIIATRSGGLIEILSGDEATFFCDSNSVLELSSKMREVSLIEHEVDIKKREILLNNFSEQVIASQWKSTVLKLVSRSGGM